MMSISCYGNRSRRCQNGLSVVELLVSLVIGMAVIAGSVQVVVSSKRNFLDQDEVSFIQANARYALDLVSKDIRMAGYLGCATKNSVQLANSVKDDAGGYISLYGIKGFEGETNTDDFPADFKDLVKAGTDGILIRRAADAGELDVKSHVPTSATIQLWENHNYAPGSTLMIADGNCRNVGLFQVSGPSGLPSNQIIHDMGAGNCTKLIRGDFVCDASCTATSCGTANIATGEYGPGSKVMEFVAHAYYVGESTMAPGMPALFRQVFNANGAPGTAAEEIALGVEDMEILYGLDTNNDGNVDQLRKASEIANDAEWDKVISVKLSLVFRSQMPVLNTEETRVLADTEYKDRYMRQVVNSTVRIRNRG